VSGEFIFREDRPECEVCGSQAPTKISEPDFIQKRKGAEDCAWCEYCYCVPNPHSDGNTHLASMMNTLERRILAALERPAQVTQRGGE
jgi:hypothetical protein